MNCLQIPFLQEMAFVVFRFFKMEQKESEKNETNYLKFNSLGLSPIFYFVPTLNLLRLAFYLFRRRGCGFTGIG